MAERKIAARYMRKGLSPFRERENPGDFGRIPATVDDMIIRYLEYCEYFNTGPDKVHHLEHIQSLIDREDLRIGFYEKLHRYIDFPDFDEQLTIKTPYQWPKELVSNGFLKKYIYELKKTPFQKWPSKIVRGIRRISF